MKNEKKAQEIAKRYETPCHGIGDCEFEAYQSALEAMEWKDEKHEQSLIDLNCKLEEQQANYEELKKRYDEAVEREKIATKIINELRTKLNDYAENNV